MTHLLDNIVWKTLTGPQSRFASGAGQARRFAKGFSPIIGFADPGKPAFADLEPYCEPGEHFYCADWGGPAPAGWRIEVESTMYRMVLEQPPSADQAEPAAERLRPEHGAQALALAEITHPGPFGPRTPELGEYFAVFDGDRLMAMAGERFFAGSFREISGVCTHPDFQGRGLARALMQKLILRQLRRGETPFLHVMRTNEGAKALYERLGFRVLSEVPVRVLSMA